MGVYDDVIERSTLGSALKLHGIDSCGRQSAWLGVGQHAEQVMGSDLCLEFATCWTA